MPYLGTNPSPRLGANSPSLRLLPPQTPRLPLAAGDTRLRQFFNRVKALNRTPMIDGYCWKRT